MHKKCIVWGAGNYGRRLIPMLDGEGYTIHSFCDTNIELENRKIDGYEIISVERAEELCRMDKEIVIIIGIFDFGKIEEVKSVIQKEFAQDTEVKTGHEIQDIYENKLLGKYQKNMIYRWEVDLEKYFLTWLDHIMSEVEYWVKDVADCQGKHHDYNVRCRENDRFTHKEILSRVKAGEIVMDIGCGLVSKFGNQLEQGGMIHLIPVDALAHFYNILNNCIQDGLKKDYVCYFGLFEFMGNIFERNYADYIIMDNALDHCIDPRRSLVECLYILKQGGRMYLNHRRAEAVYEGWSGLHKWNIDCVDGKLLIWNKENAVNVTEQLKDFAEIHVQYDDSVSVREKQNIGVEIIKKTDFELSQLFDIQKENDTLTKCLGKMMEKMAFDSRAFFNMLEQANGIG